MVRKITTILLIFVIAFLAGFFSSRIRRQENTNNIIEVRDTIWIYDTTFIDKPIPKYVYITRHDTLRTEYWHLQHDTVLVDVPIETKVYEKDSVYRAIVSGWNASLDSLWIYNTTTEITITKKIPAPKWSFGATIGPSVLVNRHGNIDAGVGATIGLTYNF